MMARMANRYRLDRRGAGCSRPLYQQLGHSRRWGREGRDLHRSRAGRHHLGGDTDQVVGVIWPAFAREGQGTLGPAQVNMAGRIAMPAADDLRRVLRRGAWRPRAVLRGFWARLRAAWRGG